MSSGTFIVIDIGKTLSKVTLWNRDGRLLDRQVRTNATCTEGGIRRLDMTGIGDWVLATLARFAGHPIEAVIPVGHGAGVVALHDGAPAFAPLDYEQPLPGETMHAYRKKRDAFAVTGSPALPDGLNIGSQLFWLDTLYPEQMRDSVLVPWAQYWAWFLTGHAVSEVTSLGCHSDLWVPGNGGFSPMARRMGWADRFAKMARADDVVGCLHPDIAARTGLPPSVKILAGLHDSNAALLAARGFGEIAGHEATVLSTGTWFIAMRLPATGAAPSDLAEHRDTLINVDAYGAPVPSARFMGGREIESVIEIDTRRIDITPDQPALLAAVPDLIRSGAMLLPTCAAGTGPFPDHPGGWIDRPSDGYALRAAVCLYAALVADVSLDLIGARGRLLIEGRFADAEVFVRALASLRPDTAVFVANAHNDVSFGALRLIDPRLQPRGDLRQVIPLDCDLSAYRAAWHDAVLVPA